MKKHAASSRFALAWVAACLITGGGLRAGRAQTSPPVAPPAAEQPAVADPAAPPSLPQSAAPSQASGAPSPARSAAPSTPVAQPASTLDLLRRAAERDPQDLEAQERWVAGLEAAGDLGGAADAAAAVVALHPTAHTLLRLAWLQLRAGRPLPAAESYQRATALDPSSLDAWLGLQLAEITNKRWRRAAVAGDALLQRSPRDHWGVQRQAFVRYQLGEFASARKLYELALVDAPEDALMQLGLGFSLVQLGEVEAGHRQCRQAGEGLQGDPRVQICLQMGKAAARTSTTSVAATFLAYTDAWNVEDIMALTLSAATLWPSGSNLWLGATPSRSTLSYVTSNYTQASLAGGGALALGSWAVGGSLGALFANNDDYNGVWLANVWAGRLLGTWLPSASLTASTWPDSKQVVQADLALVWQPEKRVSLGLAPELIAVLPGAQSSAGADQAESETLLSLHGWATWRPRDGLSLTVAGWMGERRHVIEYGGLSVWSNDDRFTAGYRVSGGWKVHDTVALTATFRHDFGDEQSGESHDFQLVGGTLGVEFGF